MINLIKYKQSRKYKTDCGRYKYEEIARRLSADVDLSEYRRAVFNQASKLRKIWLIIKGYEV